MSIPEQNKELVLTAFDTLFGKRDYEAAQEFWSEKYLQHSRHIPPGREGLFNLVRALPATLHYDNQLTVAEGDYVMLYGRYSGTGETASVVADVVRVENGRLAEHWDVWEDEATRDESASGLPVFGDRFAPDRAR
ncbi:nuclear transport factor 2 family protein [Streptomyces acidicola]|uniref:Ester cyclase n=1 Tax=Streptomyces acidicola TaxID=2596892 RepID=A0A5N8WYH8_9ACTN|nr:ester cyclase [Streptomyces acidicola]MPY52431.1 ester cyclase [Streptomyces acidicola]